METEFFVPDEEFADEVPEQEYEEVITEPVENQPQEEVIIIDDVAEDFQPDETEFIIEETDILETDISDTDVSTDESTVTTVDYIAEIASDTHRTAECVSYLAGFSIVVSAILVCVVIANVLLGSHDL